MSLEMLSKMYNEGISAVVATSHFYGDREYPEGFLERRSAALETLIDSVGDNKIPDLYLGAEVAYFPGMGRSEALSSLCILGTNYILIEMPFYKWDALVWEDISEIRNHLKLYPILAHIERYFPYISRNDIKTLIREGMILQSNSEFFLDKRTSKRAMEMFVGSQIRLLGSDSHNMTDRPPSLSLAVSEIISRGAGAYLSNVSTMSEIILNKAECVFSVVNKSEKDIPDDFNFLM